MTLTKRNKTLLAVFCIGLIALAADRTILRPEGGPAAASASYSDDSGRPSGSPLVPEDQQPEIDMADRLGALWSGPTPDFEEVRNPFALPATWFETAGDAGERTPDVVRRFIRTHRLTAIGVNGGESYVMVDDQFLVPGRHLDGFTLVSVGDRSAVFENRGLQAVLELISKD
jgi:hypothetical protein